MRKVWIGVVVIAALVMLGPQPAGAMPWATLTSCRDARFTDRGTFGSEIRGSSCGREFSVQDPYLVLIIDVRNVDRDVNVQVELLDPAGAVVDIGGVQMTPPVGSVWSHYYLWRVLPLAAEPGALPVSNPRLGLNPIRVSDPPARERLGEWKLQVSLRPGSTMTHTFVLKP